VFAEHVFDHFDAIRIINLPRRRDRRRQMMQTLKRAGLEGDPRVRFFAARTFEDRGTFYSVGARGVYDSHLTILTEAAESGHSVLVLEDDCEFTDQARSYKLPEEWQIFYGGYGPNSVRDPYTEDVAGAHCMGFRANILSALVPYLRDIRESGVHPPIDGAYVWFRRAHPEIRTHIAIPCIGNQRQSRSDVGQRRFFDRTPGLMQMASLARWGIRKMRR
jgi:glycosyl transferase family 25